MSNTAEKRITIGLRKAAAAELEELTSRTGLSQTDVINRALILYALLEETRASGGEFLRRLPEAPPEVIRFL